ncbi:MAG: glutamate racemase [Erysipelotrichaceae bacterium]
MSKIGILDSGLGGTLVLNALLQAHPNHHYLYLADQKNAPYGEKSPQRIYELAYQLVNRLNDAHVDLIVVACNTICANALDALRHDFPHLPFVSMIEPTVAQIYPSTRKVLVLATPATIASGAYEREIATQFPTIQTTGLATGIFVPLIEQGASEEVLQEAVDAMLPLDLADYDAMVLGCTHYPLLKKQLRARFEGIIYDSNAAIVQQIQLPPSTPKLEVYTSADPLHFQQQIEAILGMGWNVNGF